MIKTWSLYSVRPVLSLSTAKKLRLIHWRFNNIHPSITYILFRGLEHIQARIHQDAVLDRSLLYHRADTHIDKHCMFTLQGSGCFQFTCPACLWTEAPAGDPSRHGENMQNPAHKIKCLKYLLAVRKQCKPLVFVVRQFREVFRVMNWYVLSSIYFKIRQFGEVFRVMYRYLLPSIYLVQKTRFV